MKKPSWGELIAGLFILGINLGIGLTVLILSYMEVKGNVNLIDFLIRSSFLVVYTLLFFILFVYVIINSILNAKEKETVLLCKQNKNKETIFVDDKGKIYSFTVKKDVEVNKYYKAIKTKDIIVSINEEVDKTFNFNGFKESYWLTLYTPWDSYKNVAYLPILYALFVIFLPMIVPSIVILLEFIYDIYIKIKVNRKQKELLEKDDTYTYEDYRNIEEGVIANISPFLSKIFTFYNKYKILFNILLFILLVVLIIYLFFIKK